MHPNQDADCGLVSAATSNMTRSFERNHWFCHYEYESWKWSDIKACELQRIADPATRPTQDNHTIFTRQITFVEMLRPPIDYMNSHLTQCDAWLGEYRKALDKVRSKDHTWEPTEEWEDQWQEQVLEKPVHKFGYYIQDKGELWQQDDWKRKGTSTASKPGKGKQWANDARSKKNW